MQLGALVALYVSITALISLLFSIINLSFPDPTDSYYTLENSRDAVRIGIAFLVVTLPVYLLLTRKSHQDRRKHHNGKYPTITKWLLYLSLLIAGGVLLGDLVILIIYFLNGDITTRFVLKVLVLLVVVSSAFYYYLLDMRGYFLDHIKKSFYFAAGVVLVAMVSIIYGYTQIETPSQVREQRIDDRQVEALQDMQWRVEDYYRMNKALPESLSDLYPVAGVPAAPEGRAPYGYEVVDETNYKLCATFVQATEAGEDRAFSPVTSKNYNWEHRAGEWCYERVVEVEKSPDVVVQ